MRTPRARSRLTASQTASASENVATSRVLDMRLLPCGLGRDTVRPDEAFDLPGGDYRQQADEEQKAGEEQSETADERADFDRRRGIHHPAGREIAAVQRGHDDDEALEPHPHVDQDR